MTPAPCPIPGSAAALLPALAALHAAAFPPDQAWGAEAIGLMLGMAGAQGFHSPGQGFVLARIAADEAEILTLAVTPAARRQGHGTALMAAALAAARAHGAAAMLLEVAEGNAAARALYAALGFVPVGRRRRYYADGTDALILRCPLPGAAGARPGPPASGAHHS